MLLECTCRLLEMLEGVHVVSVDGMQANILVDTQLGAQTEGGERL